MPGPINRKKNVTGKASEESVKTEGSGLGQGPVGKSDGYEDRRTQQQTPASQRAVSGTQKPASQQTSTAGTGPFARPKQTSGQASTGSTNTSGSGIGSGTGSGLGPGEGAGSGGGVGYGTGHRGMINNIDATVNEEGQVCVEVHIAADGHVIDARVINNSKHKTTITNRNIQQQCVARAKQAIYKAGKEELRIIVFS